MLCILIQYEYSRGGNKWKLAIRLNFTHHNPSQKYNLKKARISRMIDTDSIAIIQMMYIE